MNSKQLKVVHVATSVSRLGGGLFESVRHLSQQTAKNGIEISIAGTADRHSEVDALRWQPLAVQTFPVLGPQRLAFAPGLGRYLENCSADIIHLHGLWQYPTSTVLRWHRLTDRPYVVSAHGMLEPWALKRSRLKKALVSWFYQNACLREAVCLRATAESEVENIRRLGLKNPVALIKNGVFIPETLENLKTKKLKKRALFISRIHPKKGLFDLIRAWAAVNRKSDNWELVIVGPDEGGHLAQVMNLVRELALEDCIRYGGEIWEDTAKWECYREADLFVLPSYSENFGLVIAEALGCGVPVITTHATPWEELETHRCGWWIDTGEAAVAAGLRAAMATPADELKAMGLRGRELVQRKYSWEPIGKQMADTYEWIAGRVSKPDFIV